MAALGIQGMFLPTSYGGASTEWVKWYKQNGLNTLSRWRGKQVDMDPQLAEKCLCPFLEDLAAVSATLSEQLLFTVQMQLNICVARNPYCRFFWLV